MPPSSPRPAALRPRGLSSAAKAGVSVGAIIGATIVVLCLWPLIARYVRRRRRRHASTEPFSACGPPDVGCPSKTQVHRQSGERRVSRDSYGVGPDGRPIFSESAKDLTLESIDGPGDEIRQSPPPLTSAPGVAQTPTPEFPTPFSALPQPADASIAQMVASCELKGYSSSYYNTDIPTEAFGLANWEDKRAPVPSRSTSSVKISAASLFGSLLRRATSSQKSTKDPSGQSGSSPQPDEPFTELGLSESPTGLEAPASVLARSSRSSGDGNRALDLSDIDFPPASPPHAPPTQPPPGTVNPMEVMGAMTMTERTWRTNAELMNLTTSAPGRLTPPGLSPDLPQPATSLSVSDPAAGLSPHTPPEPSPEPDLSGPYSANHYMFANAQPVEETTGLAWPVVGVLVKDENDAVLPTAEPDVVAPLNDQAGQQSRRRCTSSADVSHTDNSAYSTPFPTHSPYEASTLSTPDTRISDATPSPRPMISPQMKHGYSPNMGLSPSPQSPQVLYCDQCSQKFDQPHKLKYVLSLQTLPHYICYAHASLAVTINDTTTDRMYAIGRGVGSDSVPKPT
jgi:hypothetical protein